MTQPSKCYALAAIISKVTAGTMTQKLPVQWMMGRNEDEVMGRFVRNLLQAEPHFSVSNVTITEVPRFSQEDQDEAVTEALKAAAMRVHDKVHDMAVTHSWDTKFADAVLAAVTSAVTGDGQ